MKRSSVLIGVVLIATACLVYWRAFTAYFYDDDFQWLASTLTLRPADLIAFDQMTHFYRPVIAVYFATLAPLFDGSPVAFHAASVGWHAANALLLFVLVRLVSERAALAFFAALFFVVQPGHIDAVAWVGALGETVGAFFGLISLIALLKWRQTGPAGWRILSIAALALALLTHESSIVFVPVIVLADWMFTGHRGPIGDVARTGSGWARLVRTYWPYALVTAIYLAIDIAINSRNYIVSEGHYAFGPHILRNGFEYLTSLYVGRRDAANAVLVGVGLVLLLWRGRPLVRFSTVWMLLALGPFVAFTWGTTSRYLYQPAIGFSILLAIGLMWIDARVRRAPRLAVAAVLGAAIAIRLAVFAIDNVGGYAGRTEKYRQFLTEFQRVHGEIPSGTTVVLTPAEVALKLPHPFINAAVQWVYRDPTLRVASYEYTR